MEQKCVKRNAHRRALLFSVLMMIPLLFSCAALHLQPAVGTSPIVRVGIITQADEISFQPDKSMRILAGTTDETYRSKSKEVWQVRIQPGSVTPMKVRLLLETCVTRTEAKKSAQNFTKNGIPARVVESDDQLTLGATVIAGRIGFLVYTKNNFNSNSDAERYRDANPLLERARIVPENRGASGTLVLVSPKGEELAVKDMVRLSGPRFTIQSVKVGEGYHWSREETRTYRGELEFRITADGKLTAIIVLPLEEYLMGVVPGEMSPSFPFEALKAQAIAARTFFLYNFGRVHQNDPYDVCADVHCQAFIGDKNINDKVTDAVWQTRGLVLEMNGDLCSTPFSAVCGGHTEHSENVWSGGPYVYLRGAFDRQDRDKVQEKFDLTNEENARKWIEARPDVFCNVEKSGSPAYAAYAQKYFRWEEQFGRQQLETQIQSATGRSFGSLIDLQPVSRGVSGRLIELRVVGTTDTLTIGKELNIRKALSLKTLYSACIVFDKIGATELPDAFVIKGAGWGHGVGMCQIGAAMMAERGKDAQTILMHYYAGTQIKELY
jgi:stage II sporulation protein D